jgi:hypothetical protein
MISSVFLFVSLVEGVPSVIKILCKDDWKTTALINYIYSLVSGKLIFIRIHILFWKQLWNLLASAFLFVWQVSTVSTSGALAPPPPLPAAAAASTSHHNLHSNVVILTNLNTRTTTHEASETVGTCLARCQVTCWRRLCVSLFCIWQ